MLAQNTFRLRTLALKFGLITTVFSFYLLNPTSVAADFLKVTAPGEITLDTSFEINLEISASANANYFIKARLGNKTNQLNQGQTFNADKNVWLSDSASWQSFPKFTTDENGMWVGKIMARGAKTLQTGQNYLVVRIRTESGTNIDSATYTLLVKEAVEIKQETTPPPIEQKGEPTLNEFVPQPNKDEPEWVEIKNTGNAPADLSGWSVDDEPGKSAPFLLPAGTVIAPGGFFVVEFKSPKLNDLTDQVRLLNSEGVEIESFRYDQTERGQSWAKDQNGGWFLNPNPTPGAENPPRLILAATDKTSENQVIQASKPNTVTGIEAQESESLVALPEIPSEKTVATIAASTKITKNKTLINTPFLIVGLLLITSAVVILLKRRVKNRLRIS